MDDGDIWKLQSVKDEIAVLKDQIKPLEIAKSVLEERIMEGMSESGSSLFRTAKSRDGKRITVSVNTEEVASVKDWTEFEQYIYDHNALYLLQRRPANVAYREEVKIRGEIPGVETFTNRRLSFKHV